MGKIIAIANQKGGVAKTTTSSALAAGLKQRGYKTLAIDLDPQANMTLAFGADNRTKATIFEVLKREEQAEDAIQNLETCDIIPSPSESYLAAAEKEINETGKEHRLEETLENIKPQYDFIILDTPPALGVLTVNAFTAADSVIITTTPSMFAAQGMLQLNETIKNVKKYCNKNLEILGILITRYNPRTTLNKDIKKVVEELSQKIGTKVYNTFIRNSVSIEESQAITQDIFTYRPDSTVAKDYNDFIDELLEDVK